MRRWLIRRLGGVDEDDACKMVASMFQQILTFLEVRRAVLRDETNGFAISNAVQGRLDELDGIIEAMENVEIVEGKDE